MTYSSSDVRCTQNRSDSPHWLLGSSSSSPGYLIPWSLSIALVAVGSRNAKDHSNRSQVQTILVLSRLRQFTEVLHISRSINMDSEARKTWRLIGRARGKLVSLSQQD